MIEGTVSSRLEAIVPLKIHGPVSGNSTSVAAVVDTGFDDFLTLPVEEIASLALVPKVSLPVQLDDGSIVGTLFFEAEVDWHEARVAVSVQLAPGSPLLGMRLMEGSCLTISVHEDGPVVIEEE